MEKEVLRAWLESNGRRVTINLNILSWNILHGGGTRVADIVEHINTTAPDIVCLQELRHGKSLPAIVQGMNDLGLTHQYLPPTRDARQNSLGIFSCFELSGTQEIFRDAKGNIHAISAFVNSPQPFTVCTVHLPHKKAQIPAFESLHNITSSALSKHSIIIGDFNCGIPFEDSETRSFQNTHMFQALLKKGWIDAWRSRHIKAKEFTWISNTKNNGFRYDHALVSSQLNETIEAVHYNHEPRVSRVSDHSSMIIELHASQ